MIDIEAFKYGVAGLAIIMAHELKHVEQYEKDFSHYFNNQDVAEEAYQAAREMYDRLRPLYTYWNPLDWSTIWHMNDALEDAI
ncbi:MAG: hypothetical protein HXS44_14180 [Theionarchaea archaeon]|nr:hypothetical protein [Theionarchaea archaeon]